MPTKKKIEYMRQVKAYIDSTQQSMIRVPVDVARILENAGWGSDYVFLSYDFKADKIVIQKELETPRGCFDLSPQFDTLDGPITAF